MASIIKAGNATDGVQVSSDATGALDIKTGTGAGTTAISIDASQNATLAGNLTVTGNLTAGGGVVYNLEQYVAPATWTKPANLKAIKVTVVGGGGNSGAGNFLFPASTRTGGSGGGGGAAIEFIPAPSITSPTPGPVTVSITAGPGTNSFGAFCSATAGGNGTNATAPTPGTSGVGGSGSGGDINVTGQAGFNSPTIQLGGASGLGFGQNRIPTGGPVGVAGLDFGGGAVGGSGPAPTSPGASGAPGIVIVEEFY
jgi:hypothetical protein